MTDNIVVIILNIKIYDNNTVMNWQKIVEGFIIATGWSVKKFYNCFGISKQTMANWLNGHTDISDFNKQQLETEFKKLGYDLTELETIGNINFNEICRRLKSKSKLGSTKFSRLIGIIGGTSVESWLKGSKISLRNKHKLFNLQKLSADWSGRDFQHNSLSIINPSIKEYPEIVNLVTERGKGSEFEKLIYNSIRKSKYIKDIFLWPVLSDKNLKITMKSDLYIIFKNGKKYIIEIKDKKYFPDVSLSIRNLLGRMFYIKDVDGIIFISKTKINQRNFKNVIIIPSDYIDNVIKNPDSFYNLIFRKDRSRIYRNKLHEIKDKYRLSVPQLSVLFDVTKECIKYYLKKEKLSHKIEKYCYELDNKLDKEDLRDLIFYTNKKLKLRKNRLLFRLIRNVYKIPIKLFSDKLHISTRRLIEYENGEVNAPILEKRIIMFLDRLLKENYNTSFKEASKNIRKTYIKYSNMWKHAENFKEIINFNLPIQQRKGNEFEELVENYFIYNKFIVLRSVIVSDKFLEFKSEVDFFVSKRNKNFIVSCTAIKKPKDYKTRLNELLFIKNMLGINVIFVYKHCNAKAKQEMEKYGITTLDMSSTPTLQPINIF